MAKGSNSQSTHNSTSTTVGNIGLQGDTLTSVVQTLTAAETAVGQAQAAGIQQAYQSVDAMTAANAAVASQLAQRTDGGALSGLQNNNGVIIAALVVAALVSLK